MKTSRPTSPTYISCDICKSKPATIECQECGPCYYCYNCDTKSHAHSYKVSHRRQVVNYRNLERKFITSIIPPMGPKPHMKKLSEQTADENGLSNNFEKWDRELFPQTTRGRFVDEVKGKPFSPFKINTKQSMESFEQIPVQQELAEITAKFNKEKENVLKIKAQHAKSLEELNERIILLERENFNLAKVIQDHKKNEGKDECTKSYKEYEEKIAELSEALDEKEKEIINLKGELYKFQELAKYYSKASMANTGHNSLILEIERLRKENTILMNENTYLKESQ